MSDLTVTSPLASTAALESSVPRFRDAYQRLVEEIRAVPVTALLTMNIDIPQAVTTALGALPELRAFRERIVKELPGFDITRFDKLEAYALAVGHAHSLWVAASVPMESLVALSDEAAKSRELLFSDATALAKRNLLDGRRLKELKGPNGYRNLAFDLLTLAAMLRENWERIAGKTAADLAELDQAETLADRLITALGEREQGQTTAGASAEMRQRAYALFVSAYDQARRAVSHLRWDEGDVDTIVPSLYAGRGGRGRKPSESEAPTSSKPALLTPGTPATAAPADDSTQPVPVGLPGGDPFARA